MQEKKQKMRSAVPLLLMALIFLAVLWGTVMIRHATSQRIDKSLHQQIENQSNILNDRINNLFSVLNGIAAVFTREEIGDLDFVLEKLTMCRDKTAFISLDFAYPDGTAYRNDGLKMDLSDRWYFKQCLEGKPAIEYLESGKLVEEPRIGIAVPIIFDGEVLGVLIGDYDAAAFQGLLESAGSGISEYSYLCDGQGNVLAETEALKELMIPLKERAGDQESLFDWIALADQEGAQQLREDLSEGKSGQIVVKVKDGYWYNLYSPTGINDWYVFTILPRSYIRNETLKIVLILYLMLAVVIFAGGAAAVYLILKKRGEMKREKEKSGELKYMLEHDPLTGLLGRKAFQEQAGQRIRTIAAEEFCIIYMDIYKFKLINELFGYEKGDQVLCAVADGLKQIAERNEGICGRITGDQFVLFVPNREEIIKPLCEKWGREHRIIPIDIYLHYGVYVIRNSAIPIDRMIDCAQLAQKTIKGSYDNYLAYYDESVKKRLLREQEIITSMEKALENGEFVVYLQPQYNYREGTVIGAEALVRWMSPQKGMIMPGEFIPVFETNGFISRLDENIWEQVCRQQREWLDKGRKVLPISVNISRADLLRGSVSEKLNKLIGKYGLTADLLRVEITESAYMDNPQQLIMEIEKLRDSGFLIEMDDFGSGYSSLNMLKDVPIQVLKTDLKFLSESGDELKKVHILDNIIHMAHQMGMLVIAEGVETKEQADYLLKLNCEQMQGYYFSKPIPVLEYERLVYEN